MPNTYYLVLPIWLRMSHPNIALTAGYLKGVWVKTDVFPQDLDEWPSGDLDPCAGSYLRQHCKLSGPGCRLF